LYQARQSFIHEGKNLSYNKMDNPIQSHEANQAMPRKVSQWVLKELDKNWKAFFESLKAYEEDSCKLTRRPNLLRYKNKTGRSNLLVYTDTP